MSERRWIVVELVVHSAWTLDGRDTELTASWKALRDALSSPPHQLVNESSSDRQALLYAITTASDDFIELARRHAPSAGVASFVARVWTADPRTTDEPPEAIDLCAPQPAWPKPGYGAELIGRLEESQTPRTPRYDFPKLVAQYNASIHKLEFAITASTQPFKDELVRRLAHGALLSARALRQVAPSELTPLVDEAKAALERVYDALE